MHSSQSLIDSHIVGACKKLHSFKRGLLGGVCFSLFIISGPLHAAENSVVPRPSLVHLARQLVDSVDYNFERADNYLDMVQGRENFKTIPDGEILLLQINVGGRKGLIFNQPVLGIKQGDDVLLSLFDFFNVAQFAIDVKPAERIAEGWYIRENKAFKLDANAMTITADSHVYDMVEGDVLTEESDILVRSALLAKVFGFQGDVSVRYQRISIKTDMKWPAIERLERLRRLKNELVPPPSLPRQPDPYQMASVPTVDFNTSYNFSKKGDGGEVTRERSHNAVITGDLAGHTARIVTSGDDEHAVQSASAIFKRESDKNDLLGGLKAREYQFGDISGVQVPGVNLTGRGVGMRVTNRNPYITSDETTILEGDVAPGWDVELYRGAQFLDSNTGAEGRYRFEDVRLVGGENIFRIVKYGPLGELEEEEITIYSTPRDLKDSPALYDVSVNAADTVLWTRKSPHSHDQYTPIINGTLETRLSQDTSLKTGVSTSQREGKQKSFVHGGVATYLGGTILNTGLTADIDGSIMGTITARRRILEQDMSFGANYIGPDYGVYDDSSTLSSYQLNFSTRGGLPRIFDYNLGNYSFITQYQEDEEGDGQHRTILSLFNQIGGLAFNHRFTHNRPVFGGPVEPGLEEQTLSGVSGVTGMLFRTRWRASVAYDLDPENKIDSYNLELTRRLTKELQGQVAVSNKPEERFTEGTARLIWNNDHITMSPSVSYNSDNDLKAMVSASFGLAMDPYSKDVRMSGKKLTDTGGVSAFVYLDKDGDMTFSEGDEPIQDAVVEAIHSNRKGSTDETGQAFIHSIPDNILTDVKLSEYSLFDPLMVSATEGRSVLPRSGHTTRLEFPVHNGGELDGNVYVTMKDGKDRSAKNLRVHLYDMTGKHVQTASVSFDGFYLFQKIHPGQYWLLVDSKDAQNQGLVRPLPQKLSFGYEGTVIYSHKIVLRKAYEDEHDVPTTIGEDYAPYLAANPAVNVNAIKGNLVLNFGEYRSRALMSVIWYKLKMFNGRLIRDAQLLTSLSETNPVPETGLHTLRAVVPGLTMEEAWNRCYGLIAKGLSCKVEMLPGGLESAPHAGQQAQLTHAMRG